MSAAGALNVGLCALPIELWVELSCGHWGVCTGCQGGCTGFWGGSTCQHEIAPDMSPRACLPPATTAPPRTAAMFSRRPTLTTPRNQRSFRLWARGGACWLLPCALALSPFWGLGVSALLVLRGTGKHSRHGYVHWSWAASGFRLSMYCAGIGIEYRVWTRSCDELLSFGGGLGAPRRCKRRPSARLGAHGGGRAGHMASASRLGRHAPQLTRGGCGRQPPGVQVHTLPGLRGHSTCWLCPGIGLGQATGGVGAGEGGSQWQR